MFLQMILFVLSSQVDFGLSILQMKDAFYFRNSGKLSFVPYTKDFGRITRF